MFSFGSLYVKNDSKKNGHSGVGMVFFFLRKIVILENAQIMMIFQRKAKV